MDNAVYYALVLLVTMSVLYLWKKMQGQKHPGKSLPGPSMIEGLKTVIEGGYRNTLRLLVDKWPAKYGDMVQVNLIVRKAIFFFDADIFKRLVKDNELREFTNNRPPSFCGYFHFARGKDIAFAQVGSELQFKRKVFHNLIKFYGEGREQYEKLFVRSLGRLTETMKGKETIELTKYLQDYVLTLVGFLITGDMSEEAQKKLHTIHSYSECGKKLLMFEQETFLTPFPFLRFIPGLRFKRINDAVCNAINTLHNVYFYDIKKKYNRNDKKGMLEELIGVQEDLQEKGGPIQFDDETLRVMIQDVVGAAYLTTSSSLASLFLHLIHYQDIQAKIHEEIKTVVGDASPSFQHRQNMPYTEAVILETLRISSGMPFLSYRCATKDIVFEGHFIPKSTVLVMNTWYNHHQQSFWKDPWVFRPERFLDDSGQLLDPTHPVRQKLLPFGVGCRNCPGETFAKSRIFLVTTCILQAYNILPDENNPLPSVDPRDWAGGTVIGPGNFKCKIKPRGKC